MAIWPPGSRSTTCAPSPGSAARLPAHSTSLGKALLSTYTDEQVRKMLPETLPALTEHTITDREKLIEVSPGAAGSRWTARRTRWGCAASGWRSRTAPPRGTRSAAAPVARLTPAHQQMVKDALFDARDRLTLATRRL
ncbi:IclR family transcriptional regulator [Streptomyces hirsutus]